MSDALKVYPSGFLGSSLVEQTKLDAEVTFAQDLFNRGLKKVVSKFTANQEIVELWEQTISSSVDYNSFDFKERIVKCALQAFGTTVLTDWIATQADNPHFTANHARWIEDTVLYVLTDKRREMSNSNWKALLSTGSETTTKEAFTPVIHEVLFRDTGTDRACSGYCLKDITIRSFVGRWVQQTGGIDDLLVSLNVLFGK